MAGSGVMPLRAVPCRAVTPARCHPALPVGAVPVQQEPVVKPRFHGASTATAPPSRSSEVSSLPASSIRPRQSWFLSWGRLDVAPEPAPCRPAVAPASCLLCPAPLVPAAHPATRTGSCGATPSHPTAAFVRHPAPRGQGHCCRTARGTGRLPRCWDWALRPFLLDLEPSPSSPSAAPAVPQFPLHQGMGGTLWVPAPGGLPPRLRPPSRCLPSPPLSPRRARGSPSGGGIDGAGTPSSRLPRCFFLSLFQVKPIKVEFSYTVPPDGDRGDPAALLHHRLCHSQGLPPRCHRAQPCIPQRDRARPQLGSCSPSTPGSLHRGQAANGAAVPGAGRLGTDRQPAGRWAARREAARRGGRAKVGGGFSCPDCLSPPQRFLLPGRKPAAGRAAAP